MVNLLLDSLLSVVPVQALGPGEQEHLLMARQMQALSFAVHIPLVCFGIAFPVMVLLMEGLGPAHRRPRCTARSPAAGAG